ncbi:putative leader peptide [Streptomyces sp. NPDC056716]
METHPAAVLTERREVDLCRVASAGCCRRAR